MNSTYLSILDQPYADEKYGKFSSEPHDFGFELDHFQKLCCFKNEKYINQSQNLNKY